MSNDLRDILIWFGRILLLISTIVIPIAVHVFGGMWQATLMSVAFVFPIFMIYMTTRENCSSLPPAFYRYRRYHVLRTVCVDRDSSNPGLHRHAVQIKLFGTWFFIHPEDATIRKVGGNLYSWSAYEPTVILNKVTHLLGPKHKEGDGSPVKVFDSVEGKFIEDEKSSLATNSKPEE